MTLWRGQQQLATHLRSLPLLLCRLFIPASGAREIPRIDLHANDCEGREAQLDFGASPRAYRRAFALSRATRCHSGDGPYSNCDGTGGGGGDRRGVDTGAAYN
jgi:hypothetical protein